MKYLPWILLGLAVIIILFRKQIQEFFNAPVGPIDGATCVTADNAPGKYQAGICVPTGLPDDSQLQRGHDHGYDYGYVQPTFATLTCNSTIEYNGRIYALSSVSAGDSGNYYAHFSNGGYSLRANISKSLHDYLKANCFTNDVAS